jgi:hypothetical protein
MTDAEWDEFLIWARTNTALGRLSLGESQNAFEQAAAAGYAVVKFAAEEPLSQQPASERA